MIDSRDLKAGRSFDLSADSVLRCYAWSYGGREGETYVELGTERNTADLWKWNAT
jgi:hypothetical protein